MVAVLLRGGGGESFGNIFGLFLYFFVHLHQIIESKCCKQRAFIRAKTRLHAWELPRSQKKWCATCVSYLGLLIETQFANFKSKERRSSFSQREILSLIKSPRNRKSSESVIRMAFKSLKLSWIASTFRLEMQINVTWIRFLHKPSHAHF